MNRHIFLNPLFHLASLAIASTLAVTHYSLAAPQKPQSPSTTLATLAHTRAIRAEHNKWIEKSLQEMQTIKVGMTRAQLLKVFTEEGGVSTRTWRRYAYKECPYIKVNVEFKPIGKPKNPYDESGKDVITKISQPFLEWAIMD